MSSVGWTLIRPLVVARIKRPRTSSPDFEDSETEGHSTMFSKKLAAFKKVPSLNGTLIGSDEIIFRDTLPRRCRH